MKYALLLMALGLSASSASANWVRPVTYAEMIFGCNGLTPDLTAANATNVATGVNGEYRLPEGIIKYVGTEALFAGQHLGSLDAPTCQVEDAGEEAHPSWNKLNIDAGTSIQLAFQTDVSTCEQDAENDGFKRINHYTLTTTSAAGVSKSVSWQEEGHYASPAACQSPDL